MCEAPNAESSGLKLAKVSPTILFTSEQVCKNSFQLLNIFEELRPGERIALDREEVKQNK